VWPDQDAPQRRGTPAAGSCSWDAPCIEFRQSEARDSPARVRRAISRILAASSASMALKSRR
jgi:hypothetical protein